MASLFIFAAPLVGLAKRHVSSSKHTVIIENMAFTPNEIEIRKGDTIVWINKDLVPHTVTSTKGEFESGSISPNQHWSNRIKSSENLDYRCSFHQNMTAKIKIIK